MLRAAQEARTWGTKIQGEGNFSAYTWHGFQETKHEMVTGRLKNWAEISAAVWCWRERESGFQDPSWLKVLQKIPQTLSETVGRPQHMHGSHSPRATFALYDDTIYSMVFIPCMCYSMDRSMWQGTEHGLQRIASEELRLHTRALKDLNSANNHTSKNGSGSFAI